MGHQTDSSGTGSTTPAVVYFAKAPVPGQVKTRLVPPLTEVEAASLYAAFLRDLVVPIDGARTLVYGCPERDLALLRDALPVGMELRPQRGRDLWERMRACFEDLFAEGYRPVLIRNTDSPDLPPVRVREAIDRSDDGVVVLGPDEGGGYYLVSLCAPCPELFGCVEEGSGTAFAQTAAQVERLGMRVEALATEADVDTFDDLVRMWQRRGGPASPR